MDKPNIFREDTDFNICKSWLCGSTDGATYSLSDWFWTKVAKCPENISRAKFEDVIENCFCTQEWEDAVGYKHDYAVDDPEVDAEATEMVVRLNKYIEGLNEKIRNLGKNPEPVAEPKTYCEKIGVKPEYMTQVIADVCANAIPREYITPIAGEIAEDVAEDIYATANIEDWQNDDVSLAVGRVLCKRLGISV